MSLSNSGYGMASLKKWLYSIKYSIHIYRKCRLEPGLVCIFSIIYLRLKNIPRIKFVFLLGPGNKIKKQMISTYDTTLRDSFFVSLINSVFFFITAVWLDGLKNEVLM